MLFKSLALLVWASGALANIGERQLVTDSIGASVLLVLATAIPPESISIATADPSAFSADLASSLSAGQTPEWYQALPSDVKSYLPKLYPATNPAETTTPVASSTPDASEIFVAAATSVASSTVTDAVVYSVVSTLAPASSTSVAPIGTVSAIPTAGNSTVVSTVSSATLRSTDGANSQAPSSSSTPLTGGASYPSAVFGAGFAVAISVLSMLAL